MLVVRNTLCRSVPTGRLIGLGATGVERCSKTRRGYTSSTGTTGSSENGAAGISGSFENGVSGGVSGSDDPSKYASLKTSLQDVFGNVGADVYFRAIKEGHEMMARGKTPDAAVLNSMVSSYCKLQRVEEAESLMRFMIKKGRTPNLLTYLALMKMYGQVSRIDQAEAIFTKLTGQGITHPVLYFTMMDVLTKLETVERAESFLETVRKGEAGEGLPLEAMATLNLLLINMYLKLDEFEKAESFFNRLIQDVPQPNLMTFNAMISMYKKAGKAQEAEDTFNIMLERGPEPDSMTYLIIMDMYAKKQDVEKTEGVLGRLDNISAVDFAATMKKRGLDPDTLIYTTLAVLYIERGEHEKAMAIREELSSKSAAVPSPEPITEPNAPVETEEERAIAAQTLSREICEFIQAGKLLEAEGCRYAMAKRRLVPTQETQEILINKYIEMDDFEKTTAVYHEMVELGFTPSKDLLTALVEMYRRLGKMDHVAYLFRAKNSPTEQYNSRIKIAASLGKIYEAETLFAKMERKGITPNVTTYNIMISIYVKLKDQRKAYDYLMKMKKQGIEANFITMGELSSMFGNSEDE